MFVNRCGGVISHQLSVISLSRRTNKHREVTIICNPGLESRGMRDVGYPALLMPRPSRPGLVQTTFAFGDSPQRHEAQTAPLRARRGARGSGGVVYGINYG